MASLIMMNNERDHWGQNAQTNTHTKYIQVNTENTGMLISHMLMQTFLVILACKINFTLNEAFHYVSEGEKHEESCRLSFLVSVVDAQSHPPPIYWTLVLWPYSNNEIKGLTE